MFFTTIVLIKTFARIRPWNRPKRATRQFQEVPKECQPLRRPSCVLTARDIPQESLEGIMAMFFIEARTQEPNKISRRGNKITTHKSRTQLDIAWELPVLLRNNMSRSSAPKTMQICPT